MGFFDGIFGGLGAIGNFFNARRAQDIQVDFAKHGIQYKIEDAKRAGINPYAALGASTSMPGAVTGDLSGVSGFGQALDSATARGKTHDEKDTAVQEKFTELSITKGELENTLLAAQIAKLSAGPAAPTLPSFGQRWGLDGQGQTALTKDKPAELTPHEPGYPGIQPGANPDIAYSQDPVDPSAYYPIPSDAIMKSQSNDMLGMLSWNLRNRIFPGDFRPPPDRLLMPNHAWQWHPLKWKYYQVPLN